MQREEKEQEITEGMIEIFLAKEGLQEGFHQMISASTVRELAIGQKIVLKEDAEMVEVVQEKEVTGTEIEVSEVIEAIEETEMIEETEGIDGI
jgi:ACT domain-containing protein